MAFDVVGVGASCVDQVCRLPVFPEAGGPRAKVRVQEQTRTCGGQIATALATCASLRLRATYLGAVGDDEDGRRIHGELAARAIDLGYLQVGPAPSATATILLDATGDRIVLWHRDPALRYPPDRLPADVIAGSRLLHVDDVDVPAAIEAARIARTHDIPVTCDIDHVTRGTRELLQLVSHPVFAESVPTQLTGEADLERALRCASPGAPRTAGRHGRREGGHRPRWRHAAGGAGVPGHGCRYDRSRRSLSRRIHLRPRQGLVVRAPALVRERGGCRQLHQGRCNGRRPDAGAAGHLVGSMAGPRFASKYVMEYGQRLAKAIRQIGAPVIFHNCGDAPKVMHLYNDLEINCWGYLTPPPYDDVNLDDALRVMRPDMALRGNVDQVAFMIKATPEEVKDKVRDLLLKVKPRANWILSTTDFFFDGTPYEKIRAFAEAGLIYGEY